MKLFLTLTDGPEQTWRVETVEHATANLVGAMLRDLAHEIDPPTMPGDTLAMSAERFRLKYLGTEAYCYSSELKVEHQPHQWMTIAGSTIDCPGTPKDSVR